AAELGPKPCTMTQNKARRTNKIDFLQLPWAQEASGSNPDAPTTNSRFFNSLLLMPVAPEPELGSIWVETGASRGAVMRDAAVQGSRANKSRA
ncbi:MAG: hypothetical protein WA192_01845, partial [Candidatus Acidiferrales bacterium]